MAKIYYNIIKQNLWTIEQVPSLWKADTQVLLDADENVA